ncbi:MAG: hypothetical protein AAGL98_16690, partial [Planctomycetota bacterium]
MSVGGAGALPGVAMAQGGGSGAAQDAGQNETTEQPTNGNCRNAGEGENSDDPEPCPKPDDESKPPQCPSDDDGPTDCTGSRLDPIDADYVHYALDYRRPTPGGGGRSGCVD